MTVHYIVGYSAPLNIIMKEVTEIMGIKYFRCGNNNWHPFTDVACVKGVLTFSVPENY